ncbi:MAG: LysR family transcriptional regulator [Bacillota bacterium]|uniref:LysR family transcriptional regulator n=1 Tax=Thermanaerosceptrum fracticalcis TaxID=1712410 RepID=A0A7G6E717_THEFR|nr:LysR family transcriptional regulator [Thermanaerosceptrum fracticalcis]QNB47871.1 LysR family transcriptional regulator [Thermanaerosceptrum fracticalcis]
MELRQLEYFQMVSRLNNITRAAERLHVTQPSITIAIQKLEDELGVTLFDRSQKQITLTAEGQVFLQRVENILRSIQDAMLEMNDYRDLQKGSIKIGIPPMIGSFLFPEIFANFKTLYPHLELCIIEEGSIAIRKLLEKGELDLGIVIISHPSPLLETLPITKGEILLCLPPNHPLVHCSSVPFFQLRGESFILLKEDTYHRQIIMEECSKNKFTPNIILSSSQIETIRGLVAKGVGISFLLDVIARKSADVISLPLSEPLFIEIGLAWKKDKYLSKASQVFIEFVKNL